MTDWRDKALSQAWAEKTSGSYMGSLVPAILGSPWRIYPQFALDGVTDIVGTVATVAKNKDGTYSLAILGDFQSVWEDLLRFADRCHFAADEDRQAFLRAFNEWNHDLRANRPEELEKRGLKP